jgi:asparagine synthase (glutamine-hydrolysing)
MNAICGWLGPQGDPSNKQATLDQMLKTIVGNKLATESRISDMWALGLATLNRQSFDTYIGDGLAVALLGCPHFLQKNLEEARKQGGVAKIFAKEYSSKREAAFAILGGAFTAVVINEKRQSATIAVDRMGVHPLAYTVANNNLLFATSCHAINAHPLSQQEIDPQALYNYLYFHMIPAPNSFYRNYRRLLPGEYLIFEGGKVSTARYWSMRFAENERASFGELKEEFITTLRESVRESAEGISTGCFLSGGTDSSTMSGLLGEVTQKPARTYSIGFDEPGYDEMNYARLAAKHFGTDHHEYYVTPADIVDAIPLIASAYDQPFGNSSAVPTYYCARMAKQDGIEQLIGGDGGDELFGGNERYSKQYVFSLYEKIPESLRDNLVTPLINNFPGANQVGLLRKAKSYVQQASVPMPARLETYNLLDRIGQEKIFSPAFLRLVNPGKPLEHLDTIYHDCNAVSLINRMLALDFRVTLADNDLPKVINTCGLAGVDVAFPMLGDKVVAFSARLAPDLKLKGGKLRYFFKEALHDFLPQEIITKQKHGFGLPFGPWMNRHKPLHDLVTSNLQDLKRRGIIQPAFIDELTSQHLSAHAGYYGTMVWVLMMLEQWLAQHAPTFTLSDN